MTFPQIKNNLQTYINYNGIVFTPCKGADQIKVSYLIDSNTGIALTKPASALTAYFKTPDKVDYLMILKQVKTSCFTGK